MASGSPGPGVAWVVGATSFFGRHLARKLSERGYRVFGISRRHAANAALWGFEAVEVGLLGPSLLTHALGRFGAPQLVLHCVGSGSVGQANAEPAADLERTIGSLETIVDFIRSYAPEARLIYPSSAAVYGHSDAGPIAEATQPRPVSIYGQNKVAAEDLCLGANGLDIVVVRLFSVFGSPQRKLIFWDLGQRLLSGENPITLGGTGEETRDFMHVSDAASAVALLAEADKPPTLVNVGTGLPTSIATAARVLADMMDKPIQIAFNGIARPGDPSHQQANVARLDALGFRPRVHLEAGLNEYAAWLQKETLGASQNLD